jgi:hypothetical protein
MTPSSSGTASASPRQVEAPARRDLPRDGLVAVVKEDCPTCRLVVPALRRMREAGVPLTVVTQDRPEFPEGAGAIDDRDLEISWRLGVEAVPTLFRLEQGVVRARHVGWNRDEWRRASEIADLGAELPEQRPGCGSRTTEPGMEERLRLRFEPAALRSRRVELGAGEDPIEACYSRGWTDGLPVVPPTPERVLRMLGGTRRDRDEVVAIVPPDLVECTVEKVAINAVMAGCLPEHLPVVIAAVAAACTDSFNMHGLLATTMSVGPIVIVNGPIRRRIGMNSGINAMGQGNRANAAIGRALQLVVRNVGGGRPGGVDRSTLGQPGKYTFCFAEDEEGSPWEPLSVERGMAPGVNAVTLFGGDGPRVVVDQLSREPDSLARSMAGAIQSVMHPKLALFFDVFLIVSPEHARVFASAGWSKQQVREAILEYGTRPGSELLRGAGGCAEGMPAQIGRAGSKPFDVASSRGVPKLAPNGLWIVHAGGRAGLFSAIIGGWGTGSGGSIPITREVEA